MLCTGFFENTTIRAQNSEKVLSPKNIISATDIGCVGFGFRFYNRVPVIGFAWPEKGIDCFGPVYKGKSLVNFFGWAFGLYQAVFSVIEIGAVVLGRHHFVSLQEDGFFRAGFFAQSAENAAQHVNLV